MENVTPSAVYDLGQGRASMVRVASDAVALAGAAFVGAWATKAVEDRRRRARAPPKARAEGDMALPTEVNVEASFSVPP